MLRQSTDLPLPDSPTIPIVSPRRIAIDTWLAARTTFSVAGTPRPDLRLSRSVPEPYLLLEFSVTLLLSRELLDEGVTAFAESFGPIRRPPGTRLFQ